MTDEKCPLCGVEQGASPRPQRSRCDSCLLSYANWPAVRKLVEERDRLQEERDVFLAGNQRYFANTLDRLARNEDLNTALVHLGACIMWASNSLAYSSLRECAEDSHKMLTETRARLEETEDANTSSSSDSTDGEPRAR